MRRVENEHGAVAVIVALSLIALLGIGALVIDGGNLYWERRQLQNSADAAALAIALDCAKGDCGDNYQALATEFALANNERGAHVEAIEPSSLSPASGYVTVIARTGNVSGDSGSLTYWLAGLIGQEDGLARARSTAVWEYDVPANPFPLSISGCELENYIDAFGLDVNDLPAEGKWDPDDITTIRIQGNTEANPAGKKGPKENEADCLLPSGGAIYEEDGEEVKVPGGFRWLDADDGCKVNIVQQDGFDWAKYRVGAPSSCSLSSVMNKTVALPVFDRVITPSENGCPTAVEDRCVRIPTYVGFHIIGFRSPGQDSGDPSANYCNDVAGNSCIKGYFVQTTVASGNNEDPFIKAITTVRLAD
jgi:hypothetical protein